MRRGTARGKRTEPVAAEFKQVFAWNEALSMQMISARENGTRHHETRGSPIPASSLHTFWPAICYTSPVRNTTTAMMHGGDIGFDRNIFRARTCVRSQAAGTAAAAKIVGPYGYPKRGATFRKSDRLPAFLYTWTGIVQTGGTGDSWIRRRCVQQDLIWFRYVVIQRSLVNAGNGAEHAWSDSCTKRGVFIKRIRATC